MHQRNPSNNLSKNAAGAAPAVVPAALLVPFVLVTSLFALWGFANDITNPMVAAFKNILLISNFESSLVQAAFYGGYCFMAIPAALFLRRFNYKTSILVGLGLYSLGCLLFIPAGYAMTFALFLLAYFIMTCGLSFLETTANPYILSLGPQQTATRRLNFAQAFNPMGSITGMFIAREVILAKLNTATEADRLALQASQNADDLAKLAKIQADDLAVIVGPYMTLGIVVAAVFVVFLLTKLPAGAKTDDAAAGTGTAGNDAAAGDSVSAILGRLFKNGAYVQGVVAQAFYVGVQIMCWTFIIQYAGTELGMSKTAAQAWNIGAMVTFVSSRFICTYLLKYFSPGALLATLATGGAALILVVMFLPATAGFNTTLFNTGLAAAGAGAAAATPLYFLPFAMLAFVGISACMSLMFPTIYGIALRDISTADAKLGSAGLILAIGGGCLLPSLQGAIMDTKFQWGILDPTRVSFALSFLCFLVILAYGLRTQFVHHAKR
ncbi:MAG: L-fucose:H+ symporter permease [Puniceicoccales bacterium]|jgi:FHS family L-fucose permease-like MFS transporter|nr:L-fucose:H+ symporter permease [Puniceicoccales bacterium]